MTVLPSTTIKKLNRSHSNRSGKQKTGSGTENRFYVKRWSASKKEMEEIKHFIRENKRSNTGRTGKLSERKLQSIKKRIIR